MVLGAILLIALFNKGLVLVPIFVVSALLFGAFSGILITLLSWFLLEVGYLFFFIMLGYSIVTDDESEKDES